MMKKPLCILLILCVFLSGCAAAVRDGATKYETYKEIPGVTQAEIDAIERLLSEKPRLVYGAGITTEAFVSNGAVGGFAELFCRRMSELFGFEFDIRVCNWNELTNGLLANEIDLTGDMTATPERRQHYIMTDAIIQRTVKVFSNVNSAGLSEIAEKRPVRCAFLTGSTNFTLVMNTWQLPFEAVFVDNQTEIPELFKRGRIDAFIEEGVLEAAFDAYDFIAAENYYPLSYSPVSLTTGNPDNAPIISVIQKYLENGGTYELTELYNDGYKDYLSHKLSKILTDEEKNYVQRHIENGTPITVACEAQNYPTSFYNKQDKEFQGISLDTLSQISRLTGLSFEPGNAPDASWPELMDGLETGEYSLVTELIKTKQRRDRFLWSDEPYCNDIYAMISKVEYPDVDINQILFSKIGLIDGSAYTDIFLDWFPGSANAVSYAGLTEAFEALERGEIALLMSSRNTLLNLTNYQEQPGFKVNIAFNYSSDSYFGFNKDEAVLRSIVSKAMGFVDTDEITARWQDKLFDYQSKLLKDTIPYLIVFLVLLAAALAVCFVYFTKNKRTNKNLERLVSERTEELAKQTSALTTMSETLKLTLDNLDTCIYITEIETDTILFINEKMKREYGREKFLGVECWSVLQEGINGRCEFCPVPKLQESGAAKYIWEEHSTANGKHYLNTDSLITWHDGRLVHMQQSVDLTDSFLLRQELESTVTKLETIVSNYAGIIWHIDSERKCTFFGGALARKIGMDSDAFKGREITQSLMNRPEYIAYIEDTFRYGPQSGVFPYGEYIIESSTVPVKNAAGETIGVVGSSYDVTESVRLREDLESVSRAKSDFLSKMSHEIRTPMNAILGMAELILHENTTSSVLSHATDIKNASRGLLVIINDVLDLAKIESGKMEIVPARYQLSSLIMDVISIIKMRADNKELPFVVKIDAHIPCCLIGDDARIKQILINLLNNAVKFTHSGNITLSVTGEPSDGRFLLKCAVADSGIGIKSEELGALFESFQQLDTRKNRNIEGTGLGLPITKQLTEMMGGVLTVESEYGKGSVFTITVPQEIDDAAPVAAVADREKHSILVYENRKVYLSSIKYALDTLGCSYKLCANQSELHERLSENKFDYIFVSSLYAIKTQALASERQPDAVIVSLNGDGSFPVESGVISISMPIHCLQLANILNDGGGNQQDGQSGGSEIISMNAPNAKILVVDDNVVNLKVASGLLKTYDIQADTALSGPRAIEMVRETEYDLVFMDHMMPGMDGIDTTVEIRKLGGEYYSKLPIIALTANAISGAKEMFKAEGLNDYLSKPIEMSKLDVILRNWIPKEKQQPKVIKVTGNEDSAIEIQGLNVKKGLAHSGGVLENYLDILKAYIVDGGSRLQEIHNSYMAGDTKLLSISIHALKSASANIGAEDLSYLAAELEFACKNGDTAYVEQNLKLFLNELSAVLMNIKYFLDCNGKKTVTPEKDADTAHLNDTLKAIGSCLDNVQLEEVETLLEELLDYNWDEKTGFLLEKMKGSLDVFDYDGVESALTELIEYHK